MMTPQDLKIAGIGNRRRRLNGRFIERMDEIAYQPFDSLPAARCQNQDRVTMVRALRRWLAANELVAIFTGWPVRWSRRRCCRCSAVI
jgi:hypothetical protein